ncbi:TetR/AcrR family transcriptional regulator [Phaeobacter sp. NW0010-22]|uniref:TetR/AcrR family transcriptional regulator n=1 Tax=Phaeobacter sp. NW0010-22 TaxID=3135907 RepID=UPI0031094201
MGKIEQNKEQKRRAILAAAKQQFLAEGYASANMGKIADQAQVTKQTVYRYFPSKTELFQATLRFMGNSAGENFLDHLEDPNAEDGLRRFALAFAQAHLTQDHLETFRLLIAESGKASEMIESFFQVGPNETGATLAMFFADRLGVQDSEQPVRLWLAMLLAFRDKALLGQERPTEQEMRDHVTAATDLLLLGLAQKG